MTEPPPASSRRGDLGPSLKSHPSGPSQPSQSQSLAAKGGSVAKNAIALGKEQAQWKQRRRALELAAHVVLEETPRGCVQEEAVRRRLWKQRDHLFVFLEAPGIDATNNLAERQLRPAVIRRKLSCGNKPAAGPAPLKSSPVWPPPAASVKEDFLANGPR